MRIYGNMNSLTLINHLKRFQRSMNTSVERLTLGQRLNSPADGPADYAMSERFRTRIVASRARQSNIQSALSYLQTAQNGLDEFATVLNDIKDEVTEMIDGAVNQQDRDFAQMKIDEWMAGLDDIAKTTHYNKHYMFRQSANPTGRTNTLVAYGPMFYNDVITATGLEDQSQNWSIENALENIARTYNAEDLGGTAQDIDRSFDGGYLEDIADAFTIGVDSQVPSSAVNQSHTVDNTTPVQDDYTAGWMEPAFETFDVTDVNPSVENFAAAEYERAEEDFTAESTGTGSDSITVTASNSAEENFFVEDVNRVDDSFAATSAAADTDNFIVSSTQNNVEDYVGEEMERIDDTFTSDSVGSTTENFTVDATSNSVEDFTGEEFNTVQDTFTAGSTGSDTETFTVDSVDGVENFAAEDFEQVQDSFTIASGATTTDTFNVTATDNNVDNVTVDATHHTQDTDTHEGIQDITENMSYVSGTTDYAMNNTPNAGTLDVTISQNYTEGAQISRDWGDTRRGGGVEVGDFIGEFEVMAVDKQADDDYNSITVAYRGAADNVTVKAFKGDSVDPSKLKHTFTDVQTGDELLIDYDSRLGGKTTLQVLAQADTSLVYSTTGAAGTEALTEGVDFSVSGDTISLLHNNFDGGRGLNDGADIQADYQIGTADHTYTVSETPLAGTLEVRVDGVLQDASNYTLNGTDLNIHDAAHGAAVAIDYDVGENISEITLSDTPVSINSVKVNGVTVNEDGANGYTVSGDQILFHGTAQPFHADDIEVDFETAGTQDTYTLSESANPGTFDVLVNGVAADPADYSINGDQLTFSASVPGYGDTVEVDYGYGAESTLTLSDTPLTDKLGDMTVTVNGVTVDQDAVNGWSVSGDELTFNGTSQPAFGDAVEVAFDAGRYTDSVTLAATPIQIDEVAVDGIIINEDAVNGYTLDGDTITLHGDSRAFYGSNIMVDYETNQVQDTFELNEAPNPGTYSVLVNGAAANPADYDINGTTLTFTGNQPNSGDTVEVSYDFGVESEFTLSDTPLADRVGDMQVLVDGQQVAQDAVNGWTLAGDTITFHGAPAPGFGDDIEVNFDVGDYTDTVTLADEPAEINSITVNGVTINEDAVNGYTISGNELTFHGTSRPYYGDDIQADYEVSVPTDTFELASAPNPGTYSVLVNGVIANPADYNVNGTTLTFNDPLNHEDEVEISYEYGATNEFTLSDTPLADRLGDMVVTVDGQAVAQDAANGWSLAGDTITFNGTAAPAYGDDIAVSFDAGRYTDSITLAGGEPVGINSLTVNGQAIQEDAVNGYTLNGDVITFNGTAKPFYGQDIQIDFQTEVPMDTFTLSHEANPGTVEVLVNGQVADPAGYTVNGDTLTFDDPLGFNDQLEVNYEYGAENVYTLSEEPLTDYLDTATVTVGGQAVAQDAVDGWTVDGDQITFNGASAPEFGEQINVSFDAPAYMDSLELAQTPSVIDSITVDGVEIQEDVVNGYTFEGTTVTFHGDAKPYTDQEIIVDYGTEGSQSVFPLSDPVNAGTEEVRVNGQLIDPGDYSLSQSGLTLTFNNNIPVTNDVVDITYETGVQNEFTLAQTPLQDRLGEAQILVDGQEVAQDAANGWTITGNTLTFNGDSAPAYGASIEANFDYSAPMEVVTLAENPVTINEVTINGFAIQEDAENGYTVNGSDIIFHGTALPYYGDQVQVDYDAEVAQNTFTLATTPYEDSVAVQVNGQAVDSSDYTVDGDTITFGDSIPVTGDQVRVDYNIPHYEDTFALSEESVGPIEVLVDGVAADPADYSLNGQDLTFNTAPTPGAAVQVNYDAGDFMDRLALDEDVVPGSMTVTVNGQAVAEDAANGWTIDGTDIVFNGTAQPFYGDQVELNYEKPDVPNTYLLSEEIYDGGTTQVLVNGAAVGAGDYTIDGDEITFDGAVIPQNGDDVEVNFQAERSNTEFDLAIQAGEEMNPGTLEVTLNGQAVDPAEYTLNGDMLQFDGSVTPTYGDTVDVTWGTGTLLTELDVFDQATPLPNEGSITLLKNGVAVAEDAVDGWTYDGEKILLNGEAQGGLGDVYDLEYQTGEPQNEFTLDATPNAGSVQVLLNGVELSEDAVNGWTLDGDVVTLNGTSNPVNGDEVEINYQSGEEQNTMTLGRDDFNPDSLTIRVDGSYLAQDETNGFTVSGDTVTFHGTGIPQAGQEVLAEYGVGDVMDSFELQRLPVEGTLQMTIEGQAIAEDPLNGYTFDEETRTVSLNGGAIPRDGDLIEYTYDYVGGEEEDFTEPFEVITGLVGEKLDTGLSIDLTLTGMDMESLDVSSMEAAEASLAEINQVIARVEGIQTVVGTHEQRLETTMNTLNDDETRTATADDRIRASNPEAEMVNYMATQAQSQLIFQMLQSGGLNTSNVMSLLGQGMQGGGGYGF